MNTVFKHFGIRLLIVAIPLTALYFFAQMSFEANKRREHPVDAGLGIAILFFFISCVLFIGFITDTAYRIKTKQHKIALTNVPFLLLFIIPILYIFYQLY